ncbi:hypothetical protein D3C72_2481420 [compost metagenome]
MRILLIRKGWEVPLKPVEMRVSASPMSEHIGFGVPDQGSRVLDDTIQIRQLGRRRGICLCQDGGE